MTYSPLTQSQQPNTFTLMDIRIRIGQRIKELRHKISLSQEQLALKADLDRTYMTSVENGRRNISIQNIEKIINALDSSFEGFFEGFD